MTPGRLLGVFAVLVIGGATAYAWLREDNLRAPPPKEVAEAEKPAATPALSESVDPAQQNKLTTSRPTDGATIERQVMDDGQVVNKFTPRDRDGKGPIVIDVDANRPQTPQEAALPDPALIEETDNGPLPIIADDGTRPVDRYARPWSGARGTRIAIVIAGLGLSQTGTQRAIRTLPEEITLAFAANGNSLSRWMPEARRTGHEVLLQVPFEPFDYPDNDPGPLTLLHTDSAADSVDRLHESMVKMTNYTGIMNFLGGRFLSDSKALEPVMRDIADRGLLFLDDGTSAQSLTGTFAKAMTMPHAFADLVLDTNVSQSAILEKLDDLERIARRNGQAIGVASAFDESIDAVAQWSQEASRRGIEIVGVSALAQTPN